MLCHTGDWGHSLHDNNLVLGHWDSGQSQIIRNNEIKLYKNIFDTFMIGYFSFVTY